MEWNTTESSTRQALGGFAEGSSRRAATVDKVTRTTGNQICMDSVLKRMEVVDNIKKQGI